MPATDPFEVAARLVDIPSVSHAESAIADFVENELGACPWLQVVRHGNCVVARTERESPARLVLAGHLDTVPASGNAAARVDGDVLWGLGAADMKGGLAVMLALAIECTDPAVDATFVFYPCEEVERAQNGLRRLGEEDRELVAGDAAVLLEPTSARIEAGCQGVVRAEVRVGGVRAHTARPWMGRNAIHRAAQVLERIATWGERRVEIDGCTYRESVQAVRIGGGVVSNVVPDLATISVSHRFAPDRSAADAFAALSAYLAPALDTGLGDAIVLVEDSPAAPPGMEHPLLQAIAAELGEPPAAKLGWTDVASFAELGVPALNFGPGDPSLAHGPGECVTRAEIARVHAVLSAVLGGARPVER